MKRISQYLKSSWTELGKVSWPTRAQALRLTAAVIVFSVAFAAYIALLDGLFSKALEKLILKG